MIDQIRRRNPLQITRAALVFMSFALLVMVGFAEQVTLAGEATATPTSATLFPTPIPYAAWTTNQRLAINNAQGAWLRREPDSGSLAIVVSLRDGDNVMVAAVPPTYDGYQYWWAVVTADGLSSGYVEESSLGPAGKKRWGINQRLVVNKSPAAWLRTTPDSANDNFVVVP
ncbi:MAG: hypothetical protein K8I30_24215, partial [Anaerolineae bacterium]|nr:hypothetical protein [Anaerolineae bacterium]